MADILAELRIDGRVAIVTGGGQGLGREICIGLAEAGAHLAVLGRKLAPCEDTVAAIKLNKGQARSFHCDVCDWRSVQSAVDAVFAHFGKVDIVVNNAAMIQPCSLLEIDRALVEAHFATNVYGPLAMARTVVCRVEGKYPLSIVNVSSIGASAPEPNVGPYNSTKAALENLTVVMAMEWASQQVRVNCVAPGTFDSEMVRELEKSMPETVRKLREATILKRFGRRREVVGAVLLLASDAGSYITGESFRVSGGR